MYNFKPFKIKVHFANISARNKIEAAIKNINKKLFGENIMKKSELKKIIKEEINNILNEKLLIDNFFIKTSLDKLQYIKRVFKDDKDINNLISKVIDLVSNYKK